MEKRTLVQPCRAGQSGWCIVLAAGLGLALATGSASCSRRKKTTAIEQPRPASRSGSSSRFLGALEEPRYPAAPAPADSPPSRWDFSRKETHAYDFEQKVHNRFDMGSFLGGKPNKTEQENSARGDLLVKSQGDRTAELVLKDVQITMKVRTDKEDRPGTMKQTMPTVAIQGMNEDGSGSFGSTPQEMMLRLLFPVPSRRLSVGERVDVPVHMPFNAMGSLLVVKGRSRITLTRHVSVGGRTCAQLDADIDISRLKVPSELKGEFRCSVRGAARFYFDVQARRFVSGKTAVLLEFDIDAPTPPGTASGREKDGEPERTRMSASSDNLIQVRLRP